MSDSATRELKTHLHTYLRHQRAALIAKLDGLPEREARMPRTPTGTNLLGLVKHVASGELGYFGATFARPAPHLPLPWDPPASPENNLDMFATEDETLAGVLDYARDCFAHGDATIDALDLDAEGTVPWWPPEKNRVTLGQILVHVGMDEARHAGHADILREQLDGQAGLRSPGNNLPGWERAGWETYVARLTRIAEGC